MDKVTVRNGLKIDGKEAIDVLRSSISELCTLDHDDNPAKIAQWLSNKTEEVWTAWVDRKDATVYIAERADEIIGVGMVSDGGEILLNYVKPNARMSGVSKTILGALERYLRDQGASECFLESTWTAKAFYERCGYTSQSESELKLRKSL